MFELTPLEKVLFVLVAGTFGAWALVYFSRIQKAILRGAPDPEDRFDNLPNRIGAALWTTLTQARVFRDRFWVSVLHTGVFAGFTYYLLANLVDGLEGFFGFHVKSNTWYTALYLLGADLLTGAVLLGVIGLWIRRFLTKDGVKTFSFNPRTLLHETVKNGKISQDSGIVSAFITFHVGMRFVGQGFKLLESGAVADFFQPLATLMAQGLSSMGPSSAAITTGLHVTYWGALGSILLFLPYFARSKHIHIATAPIN
ncbi:MAG: [Fe-S]-binding protein, partial [Deinococcales bacterium]